MDHLLQAMRVASFERILEAYRKSGVSFGCAIDGGAGSGITAKQMLEYLGPDSVIYAYEPFPGNHRFFDGCDPRIRLVKKALSDRSCSMTLSVRAVVSDNSDWGRRGLSGYSSAGHLTPGPPSGEHDVVVECVRADEDIPRQSRIGFVKLDLQGGELGALKGMSSFLQSDVAFLWVEYFYSASSRPQEVYRFLIGSGFLIFDTEYIFRGAPSDKANEHFDLSRVGKLSSGSAVWYGFKKSPWENFLADSERFANEFGLLQTDLCCVNRKYLKEFVSSLQFLGDDQR